MHHVGMFDCPHEAHAAYLEKEARPRDLRDIGRHHHYYEHHIGDYAQATAHLSLSRTQPQPADPTVLRDRKTAAGRHQSGAAFGRSTHQRRKKLSASLVGNFFPGDDGWHNSRCDAEIAAYLDGEPEREAKKSER